MLQLSYCQLNYYQFYRCIVKNVQQLKMAYIRSEILGLVVFYLAAISASAIGNSHSFSESTCPALAKTALYFSSNIPQETRASHLQGGEDVNVFLLRKVVRWRACPLEFATKAVELCR